MKKRVILDDINRELKEAGGSAELLAVSKNHAYKEIEEVFNLGQKKFGENRVQEILEKFPESLPEGMKVHLIGHLQTNKVGKIVSIVSMIESVDSFKLASKIDRECEKINKVMPVLFEINTSGDDNKTGYLEKVFFEDLEKLTELKNIEICGLMTVGPLGGNEERNKQAFQHLKEIQTKCRKLYPDVCFDSLSMGMSGDYKTALKEGSTEVRIGTAIFGGRKYD